MNISKTTGKFTAKTIKVIKSTPKKTAEKTKSVKDSFVAGYNDGK
jgi:hypothetical protein